MTFRSRPSDLEMSKQEVSETIRSGWLSIIRIARLEAREFFGFARRGAYKTNRRAAGAKLSAHFRSAGSEPDPQRFTDPREITRQQTGQ